MSGPAVYDHYRPTTGEYPDGIYRVVGTDEESVTLVRVGDVSGRRINSGDLLAVDRAALETFEPADNPDGNRSLGVALTGLAKTLYWTVRAFSEQLAAKPFRALLSIGLVLGGSLGDGLAGLPDSVGTGLVVAGALGLALVGSGRL